MEAEHAMKMAASLENEVTEEMIREKVKEMSEQSGFDSESLISVREKLSEHFQHDLSGPPYKDWVKDAVIDNLRGAPVAAQLRRQAVPKKGQGVGRGYVAGKGTGKGKGKRRPTPEPAPAPSPAPAPEPGSGENLIYQIDVLEKENARLSDELNSCHRAMAAARAASLAGPVTLATPVAFATPVEGRVVAADSPIGGAAGGANGDGPKTQGWTILHQVDSYPGDNFKTFQSIREGMNQVGPMDGLGSRTPGGFTWCLGRAWLRKYNGIQILEDASNEGALYVNAIEYGCLVYLAPGLEVQRIVNKVNDKQYRVTFLDERDVTAFTMHGGKKKLIAEGGGGQGGGSRFKKKSKHRKSKRRTKKRRTRKRRTKRTKRNRRTRRTKRRTRRSY